MCYLFSLCISRFGRHPGEVSGQAVIRGGVWQRLTVDRHHSFSVVLAHHLPWLECVCVCVCDIRAQWPRDARHRNDFWCVSYICGSKTRPRGAIVHSHATGQLEIVLIRAYEMPALNTFFLTNTRIVSFKLVGNSEIARHWKFYMLVNFSSPILALRLRTVSTNFESVLLPFSPHGFTLIYFDVRLVFVVNISFCLLEIFLLERAGCSNSAKTDRVFQSEINGRISY
jgi:hypothetical protein